jgi:hypothetical protein
VDGSSKKSLIKFNLLEKRPSGAKARVDYAAFTTVRAKALTYQSRPFKTSTYAEAPKAGS